MKNLKITSKQTIINHGKTSGGKEQETNKEEELD
jgi:hypothetical protein